jgi:Leucine-rich repeat (LRR) protein
VIGRSRLLPIALLMATVGACRGDEDAKKSPEVAAVEGDATATAAVEPPEPIWTPLGPALTPELPVDPEQPLVIAHARQLENLADLEQIERLDLALSPADATERPDTALPPALAGSDRCDGLDLLRLAQRAPKLRSLRISGCQAAVHAGLSAFAHSLRELELVDLTLDGVTAGRLAQLEHLESLTLTRVKPGPEPVEHLGRTLSLRSLTLRELDEDSMIGDLLGDIPSLRHVRLEGPWARHRAMLSLSKAKRLEVLELVDTGIGNFSLNQIHGLSKLHTVDWTGPTFNDNSPLHLRELPVRRFRCACPGFGDVGLRHLRYLTQLQTLELPRSEISSAGLAELEALPDLREIEILHRDVDGEGFAALATLPALVRLRLGRTVLEDPTTPHLGEITRLQELSLEYENFGDVGAAQLAPLVDLRVLDLGHTSISDEGLRHLAGLSKLVELELHHTRITNRGLAHLAKLTSLRVLELDHTDLVDDGVAHLSGLSQLEHLRLDHTLITDRSIEALLGLEALRSLNLADTVVTREGTAKLSQLPALSAVNLDGTRAALERDR